MNYQEFYSKLFKPVEEEIGILDRETIVSIVGFDWGGPLNICTIGRKQKKKFVTYVTCELAVRDDQKIGGIGPYELMMTSDDENWSRSVLTNVGRMSLEELFEHGHTLDIAPWVKKQFPVQGIAFEQFAKIKIGRRKYGILRCHGITRAELEFAQQQGVDRLIRHLKEDGVYPNTSIRRKTIKSVAQHAR